MVKRDVKLIRSDCRIMIVQDLLTEAIISFELREVKTIASGVGGSAHIRITIPAALAAEKRIA